MCELPYNVFRKMCRGLFYHGKRYCTQRYFFRTEIGSSDEGGSAGRQESAGRGNFMLKSFEFGNPRAQHVLIQLVDDHDLAGMEKEITAIRAATDVDFRLLALQVADWNRDLSPWPASPVDRKSVV